VLEWMLLETLDASQDVARVPSVIQYSCIKEGGMPVDRISHLEYKVTVLLSVTFHYSRTSSRKFLPSLIKT